jgi:polyphosphate kinase 2 (PPK2 family)
MEAHLERNGTRIVKFFLHVSKDEQRRRFLARIDEPEKNWKFSARDVAERGYWKDYMRAYEDCLEATSTKRSPWYVVPADDKQNARLIVARIIVQTLKGLDMAYPQPDKARRRELLGLRKQLAT